MIIKVELRKTWPSDRSVEGRFFTDEFPEGTAFQNMTIYADPIPTGQALLDYLVEAYAPREWLRIKGECKVNPPDMSAIDAMCSTQEVQRVHAVDWQEKPVQIAPMLPVTQT